MAMVNRSNPIVFALKQFRHYLLGGHFKILTDHAPLQWLSKQKMEGMLCRWALAIQEHDFEIIYRKGSLNANADALSRCMSSNDILCAATLVMPHYSIDELRKAQESDEVTSKLLQACSIPKPRLQGSEWNRHPLKRYCQLWSQLKIVEGVLCRHCTPDPSLDSVLVRFFPLTFIMKPFAAIMMPPVLVIKAPKKPCIEFAKKHTGLAWPEM